MGCAYVMGSGLCSDIDCAAIRVSALTLTFAWKFWHVPDRGFPDTSTYVDLAIVAIEFHRRSRTRYECSWRHRGICDPRTAMSDPNGPARRISEHTRNIFDGGTAFSKCIVSRIRAKLRKGLAPQRICL